MLIFYLHAWCKGSIFKKQVCILGSGVSLKIGIRFLKHQTHPKMRWDLSLKCSAVSRKVGFFIHFSQRPKLSKSKKRWKHVIPWKFQRYLNLGSRLPLWPMGSFKLVQFKLEAVTGPVSKRTHFRTPKGPSGERPSSVRDPSLPFLASSLRQV